MYENFATFNNLFNNNNNKIIYLELKLIQNIYDTFSIIADIIQ